MAKYNVILHVQMILFPSILQFHYEARSRSLIFFVREDTLIFFLIEIKVDI